MIVPHPVFINLLRWMGGAPPEICSQALLENHGLIKKMPNGSYRPTDFGHEVYERRNNDR